MSETKQGPKKSVETIDQVTIRFAGDSGDGMQLTGSQFTETTAAMGNDLATISQFLTGAKALCIEQAQKEAERIDNNDMFNLENIFQTQGYSGKGEFDIEQLTLNELV